MKAPAWISSRFRMFVCPRSTHGAFRQSHNDARRGRLGLLLAVPSAAVRFRDVAADADRFEIDERLIAVIPLRHRDLLQAVILGVYGFDLLGRRDQRLAARLRTAVIRVQTPDTDEDKDRQGQTAICPRCGIDAVIGDKSAVDVSDDFLVRMHKYWFG